MNTYLKEWFYIIENMSNDNTYKLAWGRALIELVSMIDDVKAENKIQFYDIAENMLKYYWNQTFFFNLKQGPNVLKKPIILQETEKCIEAFKLSNQSNIPVWFDYAKAEVLSKQKTFKVSVNRIAKTLKTDVSWRFMIANGKEYKLYQLDRDNMCVTFTKQAVLQIKEYAFVLSQLLNYRWAQLLEQFNNAPRIANKVKGISNSKLQRNSLTKYKNLLLEYFDIDNPIDFYTGELLEKNDISIDHVIPWSFMYSDDIWNLVITSRRNNSSKNNNLPSKEDIKRLEKRNRELVCEMKEVNFKRELEMAIKNDYVNKFYMAMRL
ncbi:MAG: HNH endonuclease domain-containing protein [Erysipelotrichaceae bacterium]